MTVGFGGVEKWLNLQILKAKNSLYLIFPRFDLFTKEKKKISTEQKVFEMKFGKLSLITKGLAPDLPEDIYYLIKKAVSIRKHLECNCKDPNAKFYLILIESHIHRLAR